jgi:hypothetical protein
VKYEHESMDPHCAFWSGERTGFLARFALGIRCVICSNLGARAGATVNPPARRP